MGSPEKARQVFVILILVALALVGMVMRPFAEAFIFATVLAATLSSAHAWLTKRLGNRPQLSAGFLCAAVVLALLLPLGGLGAFIVNETVKGVQFVAQTVRSEGMSGLLDRLPESLQGLVNRAIGALSIDSGELDAELRKRAGQHGGEVATLVSGALAATGEALLQVTMMLIAFFFLLVDGKALVAWIEDNSPLRRGQAHELLLEFRRVSASVIVSSVVTSGVQAVAALLGYLVAGVPHPFFFALVTFVVAFVPAVGAGGVCLVAALLLLALGHPWAALFLSIWGVLAVGLVDNLIKPLLVKRGMHMHGGVIFFSLLGGLAAFGSVGLVLGPLIVTFLLALVRIYSRDFKQPESIAEPPVVQP